MFCNKFHAVTKRSQMHPNTTKPTETLVQGPMGCTGCVKLQRDFVAQTFALIAPVQYVLHQLSCTYETIPNAPKYYELHWNISLGSNGVDWVRLLQKSKRDNVERTFALITAVHYVLQQVSCSYGTIPNAHKYYKTDRNISLGYNGVDWLHSLQKSRRDIVTRTFALIAPVHPVLHKDSCSYETIPNAPKHYETHQYMSLGQMGWIRCVRCEKYNVTSWHELLY